MERVNRFSIQEKRFVLLFRIFAVPHDGTVVITVGIALSGEKQHAGLIVQLDGLADLLKRWIRPANPHTSLRRIAKLPPSTLNTFRAKRKDSPFALNSTTSSIFAVLGIHLNGVIRFIGKFLWKRG